MEEHSLATEILDLTLEYDIPDLFYMNYYQLDDKDTVFKALEIVKQYGIGDLVKMIEKWIKIKNW